MIEAFCAFRKNIANSFLESQKIEEIQLRDEIEKIRAFISDDTVAVITTNWDELLWSESSTFLNLVQLHGRASFPESMILPTELTTDDECLRNFDRIKAIKHWMDSGFDQENALQNFSDLLTRGDMLTHLDQAHHTAVHWLSTAEELLVWGVNFNVYDAELNTVVSASYDANSPLKKLSVIDIKKAQADLAARMNFFSINDVTFINAKKTKCSFAWPWTCE
jgi:NAD-dependent SIR2 family protein deacetylase